MLNIYLLLSLVVISIILLKKGGDFLVDGSSNLAKRFGIPPMIIALTVVSFGTSFPEFVVSLIALFSGSADIAIGNVIGSNISNIGLVIGISAIIWPLAIKSKTTLTREFPFMIGSGILFIILVNDKILFNKPTNTLNYIDGIILLLVLVFFMKYILGSIKKSKKNILSKKELEKVKKDTPLRKNNILVILGIILLALGGRLFVYVGIDISKFFGVSESFIGLTLVALGTSLPELFTSAIAAFKKHMDIALGNIIGSNILNIVFVLGLTSTIKTINVIPKLATVDSLIMIFFSLLFFIITITRKKISRIEGISFVLLYVIYLIYLFMNAL